jgi:hypothetical protein
LSAAGTAGGRDMIDSFGRGQLWTPARNLDAEHATPRTPSPRTRNNSPRSSPILHQRYSPSPLSDRSTPPRPSSPGPTPAVVAPTPHSRHSPARAPSPPAAAESPDTGSTAAATARSIVPCTASPSPAGAAVPAPAPTSPNDAPKARPTTRSADASSATSPASSTAPFRPQPPLDTHRSVKDRDLGAVPAATTEES